MNRTILLGAICLILLPGCARRVRTVYVTDVRSEAPQPCVPPPTRIRFFNDSGKDVKIRPKTSLILTKQDAVKHGDDEKSLDIDARTTIPTAPDPDCIREVGIVDPGWGGGDRTVTYQVAPDIGGTIRNDIKWTVPNEAEDDITGKVMLVWFSKGDGGGTDVTVSVRWLDKDVGKLHKKTYP